MRGPMFAFVLLLAAPICAAEVQIVDDFETGVDQWHRVQGVKASDVVEPLCTMEAASESKMGQGAARIAFRPCPKTWAHMQRSIKPLDWVAAGCDRIAFWIKGDGSGERLNLMLGNYEVKPALCFRHGITLDFTGWRQFVVPFSQFEPKGQLTKNLAMLVLVQWNVSNTQKPVDIVMDDLVALPAKEQSRFFDLLAIPTGGWSDRGPVEPAPIDNLKGLPEGVTLSRTLHGIRNHAKLHNPVSFAVQYPEDGAFAVHIVETSGAGGSRLLISVDGREVLRREFPDTKGGVVAESRGSYSVPVTAGRHTIRVDNDGADWIHLEAYRFENCQLSGVRVRREDNRLVAFINTLTGEPFAGVKVSGDVAGQSLRFVRQSDGSFLSDDLDGTLPLGVYPVEVTARRLGETVFQTVRHVRIGSARLRPEKVVFAAGEDIELPLRYANRADAPIRDEPLTLELQGKRIVCKPAAQGPRYASLGKLAAGAYHAAAQLGSRSVDVPLLVYDPNSKPWEAEGLIKIGPNGWFQTAAGRPYVPWGFATIGLFAPDAENMVSLTGWSSWCRVSDEAIVNWIGLLASYGVNCVRFGVTVDAKDICGDTGGHANPEILRRLRRWLDLTGPLGVRSVPVMWWGHYRNFHYQDIAAYDPLIKKQADWFTKPEVLALHKQYVHEVVEPFRDDPRILAWEVMNETYRAGDDLGASVRWTNEIAQTIRSISPRHLITTSAAEATPGPELRWIREAKVDFFNYHEYPTYPDYDSYRKLAGDSPREIGNYATVMTLCDRMGSPSVLLGETGNDRLREADYPEFRALITRDCLWLSFLHGSPGGIAWDAIADPREFLVISQLVGRIDLARFQRAAAPLAVAVADPDRQLSHLAHYTWWSLERGVPLDFVLSESMPAGRQVLPGDRFAPPDPAPAPVVAVSAGFQSASMRSQDGRTLLAYVRNVAAVPRLNVRIRHSKPLSIALAGLASGPIEIWDLDTRQMVRRIEAGPAASIDLGHTTHDYAVFVTR